MLWIYTNDPHHAFAVDHFAFVAHFLDGRPNFHSISPKRTSRRLVQLTSIAGQCGRGLGHEAIIPLALDLPAEPLQNSLSLPLWRVREPNPGSPASLEPQHEAATLQRLPQPTSRPRQYPRTVRRNRDAMFKMRRIRAVLGYRGPLIR